jgi:hypothetical protein
MNSYMSSIVRAGWLLHTLAKHRLLRFCIQATERITHTHVEHVVLPFSSSTFKFGPGGDGGCTMLRPSWDVQTHRVLSYDKS